MGADDPDDPGPCQAIGRPTNKLPCSDDVAGGPRHGQSFLSQTLLVGVSQLQTKHLLVTVAKFGTQILLYTYDSMKHTSHGIDAFDQPHYGLPLAPNRRGTPRKTPRNGPRPVLRNIQPHRNVCPPAPCPSPSSSFLSPITVPTTRRSTNERSD